jgi:galactonate dehydratase
MTPASTLPSYPVNESISTPNHIVDVMVTRTPVNHRGDWLFVTLTDTDGHRGFGEASHSGDDAAVIQLLEGSTGDQLKSTLWQDPSEAWHSLDTATPPGTSPRVSATAASAIEQALWDIRSQQQGVSLATLLGAPTETRTIPLYANINRATTTRTPDGFATNATAAVSDGFRTIKLAPFDEVTYDALPADRRQLAQSGIDRVTAVRAAVGPGVRVLVDCHWRFDVDSALEVARALEPLDLGWFEDPVPYEHGPEGTIAVRRNTRLPIATGERLLSAAAFQPFLDEGAADYYLPDVKHIGGIGQLLQLARFSRHSGAKITPHNPSGPISTLASAAALAAIPDAGPLEFAWGEISWRPTTLTPPETIEQGALVLPRTKPGLGAELSSTF